MPFMVLSVWASLQRLDPQIENAALSLGAGQATVLRRIVLPQIMPGILSGAIIVFALAASAFATPAIIGGRRLKVAATLAYDEFLNTLNWPLGAAVAMLLLIALVAIIVGCNRLVERRYARGVPMSRNGPSRSLFHTLFVDLHPGADPDRLRRRVHAARAISRCPTNGLSLRWFRAIAALSRVHHAPSGPALAGRRCPRRSRSALAVPAALAIARYRFPGREALDGALHVAADDPARRARHRLPALLHADRARRHVPRPGARAHHRRAAVRAAPGAGLGRSGMDRAHRARGDLARRVRLDRVPPRDAAADPAGRRRAAGCSPSSRASTR